MVIEESPTEERLDHQNPFRRQSTIDATDLMINSSTEEPQLASRKHGESMLFPKPFESKSGDCCSTPPAGPQRIRLVPDKGGNRPR